MENKFKEVMSARTDQELVKIVTVAREDYNQDAVVAAEEELKKREIALDKFDAMREEVSIEQEHKDKVESNAVGSGLRFVNSIIDFIVWLVLLYIVLQIVGLFITSGAAETIQMIGALIMLATFFGYYAIMEVMFQKTIGKFITKTKVVTINEEKPENSEVITRTLCRLIPFDNISFLFMKNGFHDSLSKTKVVKDVIG